MIKLSTPVILPQQVILWLNHPLHSQTKPVFESADYPVDGVRMKLLTKCNHSMMRNENQYMYEVEVLP
jgi:hypothetical protein